MNLILAASSTGIFIISAFLRSIRSNCWLSGVNATTWLLPSHFGCKSFKWKWFPAARCKITKSHANWTTNEQAASIKGYLNTFNRSNRWLQINNIYIDIKTHKYNELTFRTSQTSEFFNLYHVEHMAPARWTLIKSLDQVIRGQLHPYKRDSEIIKGHLQFELTLVGDAERIREYLRICKWLSNTPNRKTFSSIQMRLFACNFAIDSGTFTDETRDLFDFRSNCNLPGLGNWSDVIIFDYFENWLVRLCIVAVVVRCRCTAGCTGNREIEDKCAERAVNRPSANSTSDRNYIAVARVTSLSIRNRLSHSFSLSTFTLSLSTFNIP